MSDWLSIVGDCSSVVALLMTFFLAWQTANLKKSVMRRTRLPQFRTDLQKISEDLLEYLKALPKYLHEVNILIARIEPLLANAKSKLSRAERRTVGELTIKVKKYQSRRPAASVLSDDELSRQVWSIQESIAACIETLTQTEKDTQQRM